LKFSDNYGILASDIFLLQETISGFKVSASDFLFRHHKFCHINFNKNRAIAGTTARCAVNFGRPTYQSLQRHREVFTVIATLSN